MPVDKKQTVYVRLNDDQMDALRAEMQRVKDEAVGQPCRQALLAIIALAEASPGPYQTEPHFHAAVEYARNGLRAVGLDAEGGRIHRNGSGHHPSCPAYRPIGVKGATSTHV